MQLENVQVPSPLPDTDSENSAYFVHNIAGLVYFAVDTQKWYGWSDTEQRWMRDPAKAFVYEYADQLTDCLPRSTTDTNGRQIPYRNKRYLGSAKAKREIISLVERNPDIHAQESDFDTDPYALNTPDGTVDIRTGNLFPSEPQQLHTKSTRYSPSRKSPTPAKWIEFLSQVTNQSQPLMDYIQMCVGSMLLGKCSMQQAFFLEGPGGTGKSTFINVIHHVLGDYAIGVRSDLLTTDKGHLEQYARLRGRRIAIGSEFPPNARIQEYQYKSMTGADPITARNMRENSFTFIPSHTFLMAGNNLPNVPEGGEAFWRRTNIIPFHHAPLLVNAELEDELQDEGPAILSWMLEGYQLLTAQNTLSLKEATERLKAFQPQESATAKRLYREQEEPIMRFIDECCTLDPEAFTSVKQLRTHFNSWAEDRGDNHLAKMPSKSFTQQITSNPNYPITAARTQKDRGYKGLKLNMPTRIT